MTRSGVLSSVLALALGACASHPPAPDTTAAATPPPGCVAQTATRIPVKGDACAGFGSAYTKQDIDKTGQTTIGAALPMLDPSVQVRH